MSNDNVNDPIISFMQMDGEEKKKNNPISLAKIVLIKYQKSYNWVFTYGPSMWYPWYEITIRLPATQLAPHWIYDFDDPKCIPCAVEMIGRETMSVHIK